MLDMASTDWTRSTDKKRQETTRVASNRAHQCWSRQIDVCEGLVPDVAQR